MSELPPAPEGDQPPVISFWRFDPGLRTATCACCDRTLEWDGELIEPTPLLEHQLDCDGISRAHMHEVADSVEWGCWPWC